MYRNDKKPVSFEIVSVGDRESFLLSVAKLFDLNRKLAISIYKEICAELDAGRTWKVEIYNPKHPDGRFKHCREFTHEEELKRNGDIGVIFSARYRSAVSDVSTYKIVEEIYITGPSGDHVLPTDERYITYNKATEWYESLTDEQKRWMFMLTSPTAQGMHSVIE